MPSREAAASTNPDEPTHDRPATHVAFRAPMLEYVVKKKITYERPLADLRRVFLVHTGLVAMGGEEEFTVLEFRDALWVVPNLSPLPLAFGPLRGQLESQGGYFEATLDELPEPWRRRILGFQSVYLPRPFEGNLSTIPNWELKGPLPLG